MATERLLIVEYRPEHHAAFRDLNVEWISRYFALEPHDVRDLGDPETHILQLGGVILVAELDGVPVGTCSLVYGESGSYKLARLAVEHTARGHGIGRALCEAIIARARTMGAARVELFTNSILEPAVRLYRSLGFVDAPLDGGEARRANMRMVLELEERSRPPAG